jgi:hypothetical protein
MAHPPQSTWEVHLPNEMQISCKRLEKTYVPYQPQGVLRRIGTPARPRLSAAFAG